MELHADTLYEQGFEYLEREAYGAAAYYFFHATLKEQRHTDSWLGLAVALERMNEQVAKQTMISRYALLHNPFSKEMSSLAMEALQSNPRAAAQWVQFMLHAPDVKHEEKKILKRLKREIDEILTELAQTHDLEAYGFPSLDELGRRDMFLDLFRVQSEDEVHRLIQSWLDSPGNLHQAVNALSFCPQPWSETLLRRICRDEEVPSKFKTKALLALRLIGVQGKIRVAKFGESFVLSVDDPMLSYTLPETMDELLEHVTLWLAKEKRIIDGDTYEQLITHTAEITPEIMQRIGEQEHLGVWVQIAQLLLTDAYLHHYPQLPTIEQGENQDNWKNAFLHVMKEFIGTLSTPDEEFMQLDLPTLSVEAGQIREWLIQAIPAFQPEVKEEAESEE